MIKRDESAVLSSRDPHAIAQRWSRLLKSHHSGAGHNGASSSQSAVTARASSLLAGVGCTGCSSRVGVEYQVRQVTPVTAVPTK